jgi:hypothetical protein
MNIKLFALEVADFAFAETEKMRKAGLLDGNLIAKIRRQKIDVRQFVITRMAEQLPDVVTTEMLDSAMEEIEYEKMSDKEKEEFIKAKKEEEAKVDKPEAAANTAVSPGPALEPEPSPGNGLYIDSESVSQVIAIDLEELTDGATEAAKEIHTPAPTISPAEALLALKAEYKELGSKRAWQKGTEAEKVRYKELQQLFQK